ncbi:MAG: alpha/beta hydrolase [Gemmatimonadetes bacterium]|nr:alpha/beta hydrolase [Gemmatimonadota bacterium]
MGGMIAPVLASGCCPAWIARVPNRCLLSLPMAPSAEVEPDDTAGLPPPAKRTGPCSAPRAHHPPDALLGHSFGGKVALLAGGLPELRDRIRQLWIIDSTPEARPPAGSAWQMLLALRHLPDAFATREELIGALTGSRVALPTALWLATNLHFVDGRYRWRFDLDALEALLRSFFETDAWAIVEAPPPGLEIHFVRATESSVMAPEVVSRAHRAGAAGRVRVHDVAGGHWLNADNPDSIVHLLVENLPR